MHSCLTRLGMEFLNRNLTRQAVNWPVGLPSLLRFLRTFTNRIRMPKTHRTPSQSSAGSPMSSKLASGLSRLPQERGTLSSGVRQYSKAAKYRGAKGVRLPPEPKLGLPAVRHQ